jgi:hypothetical protein
VRRRTSAGRQALDGRIALDRIDLQILAILQREGRISKAELAGRVGLSHGMHWAAASTIW